MLRLLAALLLGSALAPGTVVLAFTDPAITESSGLVVDAGSGLFVTTNDSGDDGRVFSVDPATGDTVGVTEWRARTGERDPEDVEALAPAGDGEVWVADIGDNDAARDSVRVVRVPVGVGDREVEVDAYELAYPRGARDAETLLVDPDGRLLVVTKGLLGGEFYRTDQPLDVGRPTPMTSVGVALPIATDGAFFPDGRHVVVRSYGSAVVYAYPSLTEVGSVDLPDQEQGEGIAVDAAGEVYVSSEGEGSDVLRVRLPRAVRRAVAPPPTSTPNPTPEPAASSSPPAGAPGADADAEGAAPAPADDGGPELSWWQVLVVVGVGLVVLLVRRLPRGRPPG